MKLRAVRSEVFVSTLAGTIRKFKSHLPVIVAAGAIFAMPVAAANAAPAAASNAAVKAAVKRVLNGTYTSADLALIRSKPNIAKHIPDPTTAGSSVSVHNTVVKTSKASTRAIEGSGTEIMDAGADGACASNLTRRKSWAWVTQKSLLGVKMYDYRHTAVYCTGGGQVRKWVNRYDQVLNPDAFTNVQEVVTNERGEVGGSSSWTIMKRHLTTEIPVLGTYNHHYPWVKMKVSYNGVHSGDAWGEAS